MPPLIPNLANRAAASAEPEIFLSENSIITCIEASSQAAPRVSSVLMALLPLMRDGEGNSRERPISLYALVGAVA